MPRLVAGPPSKAAPSTYKLAPAEAFIPESVTATFDGTGAGGTFLPTLSIYSQDGKLIARSPAPEVAAGSSAEVTFAPLLRAAQAAAAGTAIQWATGVGEAAALASGVTTLVSFDPLSLLTNNSTLYSIDAGAGYTGLGIHGAGYYLTGYGAQMEQVAGVQVANPETFVVVAEEGGLETTTGTVIGSVYGRGFVNTAAHDQYDVGFWKVVQIVSDTGAGPLVLNCLQSTGVNLDCVVSFFVVQLPL